jgi:hypothetical protein
MLAKEDSWAPAPFQATGVQLMYTQQYKAPLLQMQGPAAEAPARQHHHAKPRALFNAPPSRPGLRQR